MAGTRKLVIREVEHAAVSGDYFTLTAENIAKNWGVSIEMAESIQKGTHKIFEVNVYHQLPYEKCIRESKGIVSPLAAATLFLDSEPNTEADFVRLSRRIKRADQFCYHEAMGLIQYKNIYAMNQVKSGAFVPDKKTILVSKKYGKQRIIGAFIQEAERLKLSPTTAAVTPAATTAAAATQPSTAAPKPAVPTMKRSVSGFFSHDASGSAAETGFTSEHIVFAPPTGNKVD